MSINKSNTHLTVTLTFQIYKKMCFALCPCHGPQFSFSFFILVVKMLLCTKSFFFEQTHSLPYISLVISLYNFFSNRKVRTPSVCSIKFVHLFCIFKNLAKHLKECFTSINFAKVEVEVPLRFVLILLVKRVLFGRLDSRVIDEILLKLVDNLDEFDEYL